MDDIYADFGCNEGRVFYEISIQWLFDNESNRGRIGWGFKGATNCGCNRESIGYAGGGFLIYGGRPVKFGTGSDVGDTITAAIDFVDKKIYFARNGELMTNTKLNGNGALSLPDKLCNGSLLYPLISFKDALIELNFGSPQSPCKWLLDSGFISLEEAKRKRSNSGFVVVPGSVVQVLSKLTNNTVDWQREGIIDELWVWIFECLSSDEAHRAQYVCTKWRDIVIKWNVAERHEIGCYFSKIKLIETGCTEAS